MWHLVSLQDPVSASNGGGTGSTTPSAPTSGKKGKKSRGKDAAADSGNGDAGTVENESASKASSVIYPLNIHFFCLKLLLSLLLLMIGNWYRSSTVY